MDRDKGMVIAVSVALVNKSVNKPIIHTDIEDLSNRNLPKNISLDRGTLPEITITELHSNIFKRGLARALAHPIKMSNEFLLDIPKKGRSHE